MIDSRQHPRFRATRDALGVRVVEDPRGVPLRQAFQDACDLAGWTQAVPGADHLREQRAAA